MVKLEILNNVRARAVGVPKAVLKHLDDALAETQKGAEWSPMHRRFGGRWDGKKHHFHISPTFEGIGTFPKGLMSRVQSLLTAQKVKHKIIDQRKATTPINLSTVHAKMLHGVDLAEKYSYQLDAVKTALRAEAGILHMATNAGKSEIATAMIKALSGATILFVVPKAILLKQTRARIAERLGTIPETIGVIGGGRFEPKDITVAIINSVTPAKKARSGRAKSRNEILRAYLKTIDCVFLDEGHHAKATTWFRLMTALTNARYRYLMSGTPFGGGNDLMVEAATGPVICSIKNEQLIALGVSAKPKIRMVAIEKPDLEDEDDQTWDGIYKAGIVHNAYRNGTIAAIAGQYVKAKKSVLVIVRMLAQGSNIRAELARKNIDVQYVHGQMPDDVRDRHVTWFEEKPGRVLIASSIFDEGVDIPRINALIIADGGESLRATLQKVGRSIRRKKEGANVVDVIDFADCTHHWLSKHALERHDIYKSENFEIVEEEAEGAKKEEVADGIERDTKDSEASLPPLLREAGSGGSSDAANDDDARAVRGAAESRTDVVPEGCAFMPWRWRQTA